MAILTTSQLTFYDYKDTYQIVLDKDYVVLDCDDSGAVKEDTKVTIHYGMYTGTNRVASTCTIKGKITGVTIGTTTNSTDSADGSILLTVTKGSKLDSNDVSSLHIEFKSLDNNSFTFDKYISFIKGIPGAPGRGIDTVTEYYAVSSSSSVVPKEWSTTVPEMTSENKYLWNYEEITYTSGEPTTTPESVIGVYGEGKGITSVINYYLATPEKNGISINTDGWTEKVQEISAEKKYLWNYEKIEYTSGDPTTTDPVIIGVFGKDGTNGRGISKVVEYYATTVNSTDKVKDGDWENTVPTMTETNKYLWNYEQITYTDNTSDNTDPVIIGVYGSQGRGISSITNKYLATSEQNGVKTETEGRKDWTDTIQTINSVNKYLWNYEIITYTDNTIDETDPVIIGVYGDTGDSAFTFEIYSQDGLVFKEDLTEIELKTIAYDGVSAVTGSSYKWYYIDSGIDIEIKGEIKSSLTVNKDATWSKKTIKCEMTYGDNTYEDYISLVDQVTIYTSEIKYFHGSNLDMDDNSNVFRIDDKYLVAYMVLYENGKEVDPLKSNKLAEATGVNSGIIQTSVKGEFQLDDFVYFVLPEPECKTYYTIILGKCTGTNTDGTYIWKQVEDNHQIYTYENSKSVDTFSNLRKIIALSKNQISKVLPISFSAYKDGALLSKANDSVIDTNDPIVAGANSSGDAPDTSVTPVDGQLWINPFVQPCVIKVCKINTTVVDEETQEIIDEITWQDFGEKFSGNHIYTSQPSTYFQNDVWILNTEETCMYSLPGDFTVHTGDGSAMYTINPVFKDIYSVEIDGSKIERENYEYDNGTGVITFLFTVASGSNIRITEAINFRYSEGSMLKASKDNIKFEPSDWSEITSNLTQTRDNIDQYFTFDSDRGLRIGQKDDKFYVNISATEMGFYDNSNEKDPDKKVVSIGNQAAKIKNATIEDSAEFTCSADFNNQINIYNPYASTRKGFVWKIENDGSLSLVTSKTIQKTIRGTWEEVFDAEDNGIYKQKYKIGDTLSLDLGPEGVIDMQIAAFDTDMLIDESGYAPITWVAKHVLNTPYMMSPLLVTNDDGTYKTGTGAIGGWFDSQMRQYLSNFILPLIPKTVSNNIKIVKKYSRIYNPNNKFTTEYDTGGEQLWIPSLRELGKFYDADGPIYSDLFIDNNSCIKYDAVNNVSKGYWTRTAVTSSTYGYIGTSGSGEHENSFEEHNIVICFCT